MNNNSKDEPTTILGVIKLAREYAFLGEYTLARINFQKSINMINS